MVKLAMGEHPGNIMRTKKDKRKDMTRATYNETKKMENPGD
jgi:hypothetical protein